MRSGRHAREGTAALTALRPQTMDLISSHHRPQAVCHPRRSRHCWTTPTASRVNSKLLLTMLPRSQQRKVSCSESWTNNRASSWPRTLSSWSCSQPTASERALHQPQLQRHSPPDSARGIENLQLGHISATPAKGTSVSTRTTIALCWRRMQPNALPGTWQKCRIQRGLIVANYIKLGLMQTNVIVVRYHLLHVIPATIGPHLHPNRFSSLYLPSIEILTAQPGAAVMLRLQAPPGAT